MYTHAPANTRALIGEGGIPHHLVFAAQPTSGIAGRSTKFSVQPIVHVLDVHGQLVTGFTGPVTIAKKTGSGSLHGKGTINAVAGVADYGRAVSAASKAESPGARTGKADDGSGKDGGDAVAAAGSADGTVQDREKERTEGSTSTNMGSSSNNTSFLGVDVPGTYILCAYLRSPPLKVKTDPIVIKSPLPPRPAKNNSSNHKHTFVRVSRTHGVGRSLYKCDGCKQERTGAKYACDSCGHDVCPQCFTSMQPARYDCMGAVLFDSRRSLCTL